MLGLNVID